MSASTKNHARLTPESWVRFTLDQHILMIGNEMNCAMGLFHRDHAALLKNCYERALRLADLTIEVNGKATLRRELLRWRDLIAAPYISPDPDRKDHVAAFRVLLQTRVSPFCGGPDAPFFADTAWVGGYS